MGLPYAEVIGDPIAHSKSPLIHRFWLGKLGLEAGYRPCRVPVHELPAYISERKADPDWRGCNLTMPLKLAAMSLSDRSSPTATAVGAANTMFRRGSELIGTNTDLCGIAAALRVSETPGNRVCLIGSGAAARAALLFLRLRKTMEVSIVARDLEEARRLHQRARLSGRVYSFADCREPLEGAEWVINATSLGMRGEPAMPDDVIDGLAEMEHCALVFDMVYAPRETPLLRRARELGLHTADGLTMLVAQAAPAFRRFFGAPAPREHDAELRELLTR
jgi:shikimate dehydrogenase